MARNGFLTTAITVAFIVVGLGALTPLAAEELIWSRNYGGQYNESAYAGVSVTSGGFVVLGSTYSFGLGDHDIFLIRIDSYGDTLWTRTLGGQLTDYGYDIQTTSDGGFIIVGMTRSFGAGNGDVYLVKTDSTGSTLWTNTFGGTERDEGWSVRQTADGGYIVGGITSSFGAGESDLYLIKTDTAGVMTWSNTFGGVDSEWGAAVRACDDGNYILVGSTVSYGSGYCSLYAVKADAAGDSLWTKLYGGNGADLGYSVEVTTDSGFIFVGSSSSFGDGSGDVYVVKTDADGAVAWENAYGGNYEDRAYTVQQTPDGGYVVAGISESFGFGKLDMYLLTLDAFGESVSSNTYGGTESDYCRSIFMGDADEFFMVGYSYSYSNGGSDAYVLKIKGDSHTDVEIRHQNSLPDGFALGQNFPNPFNPETTIPFSIPRFSYVHMVVFNILGQEVVTLVDAPMSAGDYQARWDGRSESGHVLSTGIYFYHLQAGDISFTRKMLLIK